MSSNGSRREPACCIPGGRKAGGSHFSRFGAECSTWLDWLVEVEVETGGAGWYFEESASALATETGLLVEACMPSSAPFMRDIVSSNAERGTSRYAPC